MRTFAGTTGRTSMSASLVTFDRSTSCVGTWLASPNAKIFLTISFALATESSSLCNGVLAATSFVIFVWANSEYPKIALSTLLKSCATPRASVPSASIFCPSRRCFSRFRICVTSFPDNKTPAGLFELSGNLTLCQAINRSVPFLDRMRHSEYEYSSTSSKSFCTCS